MNDQTEVKRPILTKEQQKQLQDECDHVGFHGPVSQNSVVNTHEILVISTHACMYCGKLFMNISPVPLAPEPQKSKTGGIIHG